jgi:hypothetical protein
MRGLGAGSPRWPSPTAVADRRAAVLTRGRFGFRGRHRLGPDGPLGMSAAKQSPAFATCSLVGCGNAMAPRPDLSRRRPASISSPSALEDRKTAGAYDEPENDQYRAEDDVARNEQDDPHDDEDYGDEPPDETHGSLLPTPSSSHTLAGGLARPRPAIRRTRHLPDRIDRGARCAGLGGRGARQD